MRKPVLLSLGAGALALTLAACGGSEPAPQSAVIPEVGVEADSSAPAATPMPEPSSTDTQPMPEPTGEPIIEKAVEENPALDGVTLPPITVKVGEPVTVEVDPEWAKVGFSVEVDDLMLTNVNMMDSTPTDGQVVFDTNKVGTSRVAVAPMNADGEVVGEYVGYTVTITE